MKPDLSIIIVNYNTKDLTLKCVESVRQSMSKSKLKWEIIVVDNASIDPPPQSDDYKLIKNKENVGFSRANNQGMRVVKGNYILLLNSDTEVKKGSIDKLYEFARANEDVGVVSPRLLNPDGSIQGSVFRTPTIWRNIRQYFFGEENLLAKYAPDVDSPVEVEIVSTAAFMITPTALKEVGFLSEKYFMFFEEFDYSRRVKEKGLKIVYFPNSEVIHYHGASGEKLAVPKEQWRRLIPSSKIYHGPLKHYLLFLISWMGQKFGKFIPPVLLILLTVPAIWNLLKPGYFPMQDDLQTFRIQQMDRCFDDFQIPCRWVPDAGYQYGYPQFNYYPPLPYYLGALLHRVGFQYIDSVKILFVAGYILSAIAIYILVRSITNSWSGLIAGALYTYIPYKAVEVYVRGAMSEFWAQIFFPLIFWAIYKLIKEGKIKYLIWLSLFSGMLATTHTLMTMIFVPIALVWALFWLIRYKWNNFFKVLIGGLLGFGLSAFFTLPVIFERQFAHVESLLSGYFDYRQHFVSLQKLFLSMEWGYGSSGFPNEKLNLSLGIIHWVVGLLIAPVLALVLYKKKKKLSILVFVFSILSLFTIFMMHLRSSFIWSRIPILAWLQFPWRILAISIFLLTLTVGLAICLSGKFKYILGISFVLIAFILYFPFFIPKDWLAISDSDKFSGINWEKQLTISIFDYLPIYATLPPWSKAPELPEVLEGEAQFLEYRKRSNFQTGIARVSGEALIRLPLFDFPGMVVQIDGQEVPHWNNDCRGQRYCLGLITFNLENGTHTILAKLYDTPIRRVGNIITLGGIGVLVFLVIKSRR